jgi:hypothetical protein
MKKVAIDTKVMLDEELSLLKSTYKLILVLEDQMQKRLEGGKVLKFRKN